MPWYVLLRLVAASLVGMVLGLNRDLKGKPTGARTLALVSLGAALVAVSTVHYPGMGDHPDAMSRILQGIIVQQLSRVRQVGHLEAFGEPAVDRGEQVAGFDEPALVPQQAGEARRGAQLPHPGTLPPSYFEGAPGAGPGLADIPPGKRS